MSIESNGISNRSNRNSQKFSNDRKIARMARILTIFGPFEPQWRQLQFPKISNERKIIESIESIDSIERSRDRPMVGPNGHLTEKTSKTRWSSARPPHCFRLRRYGRRNFRSRKISAEKIFGRKHFRPKKISAENIFFRKSIRPKF